MSGERTVQSTTLTWISGGLVVGAMAFLGLGPRDADDNQPATKLQSNNDNSVAVYTSITGTKSVPSSMWDDPFESVNSGQIEGLSPESGVRSLLENKLGSDGRIMYLVVPVHEGNTSERLELRRRRRHAVELATANQGFSLSFPDRMTYRKARLTHHFTPRLSKDVPESDLLSVNHDVLLPTKLYKSKTSNLFILTTWIQESHLGERPLDTLRDVVQPVLIENAKARAAFCLLGPSTSDTLRVLIRDAKQIDESDEQVISFFEGWGLGTVVCNCLCTAMDERLGLEPGQACIPIGRYKGLGLIHTIGSDDRLLNALQHELTLRGVWPSDNSPGQLVIFAEQSSLSYIDGMQNNLFYSRHQRPIVIPYLKGIAMAGSEQAGVDSKTSPADSSSVQDYLDRSMTELEAMSSTRTVSPSKVRAVGILGSSWEDKNLILEKARRIFPVATFFTTELDARYNLPEFVSHTRNLVVASHYGLWVSGRREVFGRVNNIPSFRDGYQTSTFIGMSVLCHALQANKLNDAHFEIAYGEHPQDIFDLTGRRQTQQSESPSPALLQPLAFEIGSTNPIQLPSTQSPEYLPLRQPAGVSSIHEHPTLTGVLLVAVLGILLSFNFLAAFSTDASEFRDALRAGFRATLDYLRRFFLVGVTSGRKYKPVWHISLPLLIGVALLFVMVISDNSEESEPILFTEGISIWPTIWGLYLVIALSLREICRPLRHLSAGDETEMSPPDWTLVVKLAFTIAIVFYLISFLESGFIQPPARDWVVRWLAIVLLFGATSCILLVTCKCLLFSLYARKVIESFRERVDSNHDRKADPSTQQSMVNCCRRTMKLSIDASRKLLWPAALSILFIVARWRGWDAWGQDRSWYVLLGTPIVISFVAALVVRLTAVQYRHAVLEFLRRQHYNLFAAGNVADSKEETELLDESIEEVTRLDRGPFGPLSQDYLLGAAGLVATLLFTGPLGALLNRVFEFMP